MKIQTALSKFLVQLEADGRAESTIAQYRRHVRLFAYWARDDGHSGEIKKITHETLAEFLASPVARTRRGGGQKKATSMNVLRSSLKAFFGYVLRAGLISTDPSRLIRMAVCGTAPPKALPDSDVTKLMKCITKEDSYEAKRDLALFQLILSTGIRLGSAVAVDADDVDLDSGIVQLRVYKGDREEHVYLNDDISQHLRKYISGRERGPLFTTRTGRRITRRQVQRRFSQWTHKANIQRDVSVHSLRHSFAIRLYKETGDIFLVKEALRHRSIVSTLVYARQDENRLRRVLQS